MAPVIPVVPDQWSSKVVMRERMPGNQGGDYLAPVHGILSPQGHVMLFGYKQLDEEPLMEVRQYDTLTAIIASDDLREPLPAELYLRTFAEPRELDFGRQRPIVGSQFLKDSLFCCGHTLLEDGTLFTAGGIRVANNWYDQAAGVVGLHGYGGPSFVASWSWDPGGAPTGVWDLGPHMIGIGEGGVNAFPYKQMFEGPERFYPTTTRLPDGRVLITGGFQVVNLDGISLPWALPSPIPARNSSVEIYDPEQPQSFTLLSTHQETPPEIFNVDYTHTFVLPAPLRVGGVDFDVIMVGESARPVLMSTTGSTRWSGVAPQRRSRPFAPSANPNLGAATTLLPFRLKEDFGYRNGALLVAGGEDEFENQFDVFDPIGNAGGWVVWGEGKGFLSVDRHHPDTVLLPDGTVAVLAGWGDPSGPDPLLQRVDYIHLRDPDDPFQLRLGSSSNYAARGYHSVALLLPDGRVLVTGGGQAGVPPHPYLKEKANFEILSPPYMTRSRPAISSVPSEIKYGEKFTLTADRPIEEAVLISLGSMTHSFDMNQRYIEVAVLGKRVGPVVQFNGIERSEVTTAYVASIQAPDSRQLAPPGHYMLFILDGAFTPSEARIVRLR